MYNGIAKIEEVIDYIELNLTNELDYNMLAAKMNLSVYEFRRIFSFVVGCPLSEYIRKRKLSLAATELMTCDKVDISQISEKYGYSNQSSFTRAFCEQHGISPSECNHSKSEINLFTRPKFSVAISGRENVPFKIIKEDIFFIKGFSGISLKTDTCCCENVWNSFYESGADKNISSEKLYVAYFNHDSDVLCCIGEKSDEGCQISRSFWACFKMDTVDDDVVNETYNKILLELLPSANLKKNNEVPTVEVYPFDMSEDGFEWEIRIPIEQGNDLCQE
ncbi:MAG: AraC family transcriptional regulator [Clostridia bacterium]|nr:AraC family transcriptional regulator [Clostridia bacterium]